ncbi:FAD-binding domain-containing protein [Eremomyces bilateralis CBS 781.70]|uniref:FAD-binding domain-containing protein n=1 Tax=Eremomyces bilateralis CBS 781.70 TaxID=1392243 RepID=A0A6G1G6G6_9PEZI|nr:FAD-binding domain-containing protein [Eremomyces bilateralis CBS 781.70]KAF1813612.1 FAD-binding domain-containing protein [Eremomyces bilateralis CBS 781.70]
MVSDTARKEITTILSADEVIHPSSEDAFVTETKTWSAGANRKPGLVVRPANLTSLQKIVKYLCDSDLEFAVRSTGTGDATAQDVVISLSAFDDVQFDEEKMEVLLGAGQEWGSVYPKFKDIAPGYAVPGARQPFVGVGGSILGGGVSWLSMEHGLISNAKNLLDAQVVLADGSVVWASSEPDLMWAIRGGGGNFGVLVNVKLRAYKEDKPVFFGPVLYPESSIEAISKAVADFIPKNKDPKVAIMAFATEPNSPLFPFPRGVGLLLYDANGEDSGRKNFQWAFEIEGAKPMVGEMPYYNVVMGNAQLSALKGKTSTFGQSALVKEVDPGLVARCMNWYFKTIEEDETLAHGSYVLFEHAQPACFGSSEGKSAWPYNEPAHLLQLGVGYLPESSCSLDTAMTVLGESFGKIVPGITSADFMPNFINPKYTDIPAIFGKNYQKLREVKTKYDPKDRFSRALMHIPPIWGAI